MTSLSSANSSASGVLLIPVYSGVLCALIPVHATATEAALQGQVSDVLRSLCSYNGADEMSSWTNISIFLNCMVFFTGKYKTSLHMLNANIPQES